MAQEPSVSIRWIKGTASTNSYLKENGEIPAMCFVAARTQTAGRGQRGNSWEAEPGKNLTFSFRFKPEGLLPSRQFIISQAVALAMVEGLRKFNIRATVKWPNDIYVGNMKISGILIENQIMGSTIQSSLIGIGLNVNQTEFKSDAPNPVSMSQITEYEYDLKELLVVFGGLLEKNLLRIPEEAERIQEEYMSALWRGDGSLYPFREAASGESFQASISGIEPTGHLTLTLADGSSRRYAFKEVEFLLPEACSPKGK